MKKNSKFFWFIVLFIPLLFLLIIGAFGVFKKILGLDTISEGTYSNGTNMLKCSIEQVQKEKEIILVERFYDLKSKLVGSCSINFNENRQSPCRVEANCEPNYLVVQSNDNCKEPKYFCVGLDQ